MRLIAQCASCASWSCCRAALWGVGVWAAGGGVCFPSCGLRAAFQGVWAAVARALKRAGQEIKIVVLIEIAREVQTIPTLYFVLLHV